MEPFPALDDPGRETDNPYFETIALLQEEIARLEEELLHREDFASQDISESDASQAAADDARAETRINELTSSLQERDDTIALLWEQLSTQEEVQAARAAEWDQLHRWVEELEARFGEESLADRDPGIASREAEALRDQIEFQRKGWEEQKRRLEAEVVSLQGRLEVAAHQNGDSAQAELEAENRQLREECRRLSQFESESSERQCQIDSLNSELERAREQLWGVEEDLRIAQLRHVTELAETRRSKHPARSPRPISRRTNEFAPSVST